MILSLILLSASRNDEGFFILTQAPKFSLPQTRDFVLALKDFGVREQSEQTGSYFQLACTFEKEDLNWYIQK